MIAFNPAHVELGATGYQHDYVVHTSSCPEAHGQAYLARKERSMNDRDIVSGQAYQQSIHELTRELRTAQRLVHQLMIAAFGLAGTTAMFGIMWLFEFVVNR